MRLKNINNVVLETGNIIRVCDAKGVRCGRILNFFNESRYTLAEIDVGETYFYWYKTKWAVKRLIYVDVDRIYNVDYANQGDVIIISIFCYVGDCMLHSPNTFKKVD